MNNEKQKLKVLMVGIDNYPNPNHRLNGCVNDLRYFKEYLDKRYCPSDRDYHIKTLIDDQATRAAVIATFRDFFSDLSEGDSALFYYAGHGSRGKAPDGFLHTCPDGKYESMVCYDSRAGSSDLADIELGYLIWTVTTDKEVSFTVITDCCHSAGITRAREDSTERQIREVEDRGVGMKFLGQETHKDSSGDIYVPSRSHVLLAACRNNQTAKEKVFGDRKRGVFTLCLLRALRSTTGPLTYHDLSQRIAVQVHLLAEDQHPQLATRTDDLADQLFLETVGLSGVSTYLVHHDLSQGWVLNAGRVHGLQTSGSDSSQGRILLFAEDTHPNDIHAEGAYMMEVGISEIMTDRSILDQDISPDLALRYKAIFSEIPVKKISIYLSPDGDPDGLELIIREWNSSASQYLDIVDDIEYAAYVIHAQQGAFMITVKDSDTPLFRPIKSYTEQRANQFFEDIETFVQWLKVKSIQSHYKQIDTDIIDLDFYKVLEADQGYLEAVKEEKINLDLTDGIDLPYLHRPAGPGIDQSWEEPMFRLKVTNTGTKGRQVFCTLLYLGSDYSINSELMQNVRLGSGEQAWAEIRDAVTDYYTKLIPLHIQDAYRDMGIHDITEYFKLIVSTKQINTASLCQDGIDLKLDIRDNKRGWGRKDRSLRGDYIQWVVHDFNVRVIRPVAATMIA